MPKPKVAHFILDGFCPANEDNYYDNFHHLDSIFSSVEEYVVDNPDTGFPRSPDLWTRCYSRKSYSDLSREGDNGYTGVTTYARRIPSNEFLWNKVVNSGYPSWIYLYGQYYYIARDNLIDSSDSNKKLSGVLKMYGGPRTALIDNGEVTRYKSDISFWGLHEPTAPGNKSYEAIKEFINSECGGDYKEFMKVAPQYMHDYFKREYLPRIEDNKNLYDKEIFPHIQKHLSEFENGGYLNLGIIETDPPYHFFPFYEDLIQEVRDYVCYIIDNTIKIYNPDIVIITGDHGMESVYKVFEDKRSSDSSGSRKLFSFNYEGKTRQVACASFGVAPLFTDHSNKIGGVLFCKDKKYQDIFQNKYFKTTPYFMYDVYDYISDLFGKDTSNE